MQIAKKDDAYYNDREFVVVRESFRKEEDRCSWNGSFVSEDASGEWKLSFDRF